PTSRSAATAATRGRRSRPGSRSSRPARLPGRSDWTSRPSRAWNERMSKGNGDWGRIWRYEGKRGVRWRIRYTDAAGKRVLETLGREPAWNRRRAEAELRARLVDVERNGYRKPEKLSFAAFAEAGSTTTCPGAG